MTIRQLRTLVAIADTKTFSAAADKVHITHAAVSQQMQSLEADLGVQLFDRTTRTPQLTPLAHQIVEKARRLVGEYDGLVPSVLSETGVHGTLKLGSVPTTLTGLTPQAMAVLKQGFPDIRLHIRSGLTSALLVDLERGDLDAAIVTQPHILPQNLDFFVLAEEPMRLIAGLDAPDAPPLSLLETQPYIRFDRKAELGALIENWIVSRKITVSETMELGSPEAIASMVHANLGVSIVPALAVPPPDQMALRWIDLGPGGPRRTLGLVSRKAHPKSAAIDAVRAALLAVIARAGADEARHDG